MQSPALHGAVCFAFAIALGLLPGCDKDSSGGAGAAPSSVGAASASPSPTPAAESASAAMAAASAFAAKGAARRHVGLAGVLLHAAYDFELTDPQRATLDKAEDALYADTATDPWEAMKTFNQDYIAGIRSGKIDNAKLTADYAAIDKLTTEGQSREADALNTLHGALDANQRQALVDQVYARRNAHPRRTPPGGDGGAGDWAIMKLNRLSGELQLDDGQKKTVAALIAKDPMSAPAAVQARHDAAQKQFDTLLSEFVKDSFDAKKLNLAADGGKTPHEMLQARVAFTTAMLPALHPDQREKLAIRTERMARRADHGGDELDRRMLQDTADEDVPPHSLR